MSRYIPVYPHYDRMPIDISFLFEDEVPAGKHGFCKVDGDHFAFEDGTKATFWGVIPNGASNFPEHDYAEKCADRLAQAGCNFVRFHQLDADWHTPNLFRFSAGRRVETTRKFDPKSMERLDYWIKCLKERGLYASVDMTTYRRFTSGDGVVCPELLSNGAKMYSVFDPHMIELQKEFCTNFWEHYNPYTELKYKDDPFFAFCIISNEVEPFRNFRKSSPLTHKANIPYYEEEYREMFRAWLRERGSDREVPDDLVRGDAKDPEQVEFCTELHQKFCETMYAHIRSLGVKIPITGTNYTKNGAVVKAQRNMDFQDSHCYYRFNMWEEQEKVMPNRSMIAEPRCPIAKANINHLYGQPMFMTEWDNTWPNSYRAEGPIYYPAIAALQGYSGMSIHTYGYSPYHKDTDVIGKESEAAGGPGGSAFREGMFTVWNDPAKFGLFYHGALMMRRGDVRQAEKTVGSLLTGNAIPKMVDTLQASAMDFHRVVSVLPEQDKTGLDEVYDSADTYPGIDEDVLVSDTGELWRDKKRKIGAVDTPRTKVVYGALHIYNQTGLSYQNRVDLNGMSVKSHTDFAVVAASSLSDKPLNETDNILLSTIGRACNTGMSFDGEKLLDYGRPPIQVEVIDAEIEIETVHPDLVIWSIDSNGYMTGRLNSVYEDGRLKFHVGPKYASPYYLIYKP